MPPPNPWSETEALAYGPTAITRATEWIAAGWPVAVPTETVYGLAADARDDAAVARVYAAKGRPAFNPLIVHVPDPAAGQRFANFDTTALRLAGTFWPGPLTLVLPLRADAGIASLVTAGLPAIALRVPAHPAMRELMAATGAPLAAPSANASGGISPTRAAHVLASLDGRIPLVIDGGRCAHGLESTIVAVADDRLRMLRPGPIGADALTEATGLAVAINGRDSVEAPGQLASHYAPAKPLRLHATEAHGDEWLIGFGPVAGDRSLSPSGDPVEAAAALFDALHEADASGRARIAVAPIPADGLGTAIKDRLARAATPRVDAPGPLR